MEAAAPLLGCVDGTVQAVLPLLGVDTDKSDAVLALTAPLTLADATEVCVWCNVEDFCNEGDEDVSPCCPAVIALVPNFEVTAA